jgi:hypothetical protein
MKNWKRLLRSLPREAEGLLRARRVRLKAFYAAFLPTCRDVEF